MDLRKKIVESVKKGVPKKSETARRFGVDQAKRSQALLQKQLDERATLEPRKAPGKRPKLDEKARKLLVEEWTCVGSVDCLRLRKRCAEWRAVPPTNPAYYPPEFRREAIQLGQEPPTQSIPSPGSPGRSVSPMAPFGALGQPGRDRLRRASGAHNRAEEGGGATQAQAREVKTLRQERKRSSEKQPAFFARERRDRGSVSAFSLIDLRRRPATR